MRYSPRPLSNGPRCRIIAVLSVFLCLGAFGTSRAQDSSAWDTDQRSGLRLIAGSAGKDMLTLRAGIEMRIDAGWKTYWRYAGDSGLPPSFDFSGSDNVTSVTVLWPAPRRFADGAGGNSIGYTGAVIFPLQVVAKDSGTPVTLRLKADYGVCENICIPATGKAQLRLGGRQSAEESALAAAETRVPKKATLGDSGPLAIRAARRDASGVRQRVIVDVAAPDGADIDLFAEGPTSQWSLPLPQPLESGPGKTRRFAFDVDGVPAGSTIVGAPIKLTLVAGKEAIEVTIHLD